MTTLIDRKQQKQTGSDSGRAPRLSPPLATSGADVRSQLLAGMLAAAHGVSDFFPGDGAELRFGEMRPECVQPLSFQRRYDNQTWAAGPLPRARCPPFCRVHGLSGVFAAPGGHEFTVQEELPCVIPLVRRV